MLTTARPIFQNVPASYADPVGLADQQAPGVVSLIVVRYEPGDGQAHDALGPFYDGYVAVSGQLLAVARTTADYRYPVTPSVGLARFIEHRDGGRPAFLSVYELAEDDCARFLETVFYSECLKLHVDGAGSAPLVAQQIVRSGCGDGPPSGILEVNDFSQPDGPRIRLVDLDSLPRAAGPAQPPRPGAPAAPAGTVPASLDGADGALDPVGLAAVLAGHLDGVVGRVLLYDRAKNRAAMPHRAGKPFDLEAAVEQANRLADARRSGDPAQAARQRTALASGVRASAPDDPVERVEEYLRDAAEHPAAVAPTHPHRTGLAALVAELQGGGPAQPFAGLAGDETDREQPVSTLTSAAATAEPPPVPRAASAPGGDGRAGPEPAGPGGATSAEPPTAALAVPTLAASVEAHATPGVRTPATAPSPPAPGGGDRQRSHRHVLATELDVLRAGVYALFEDAVGRDKAVAHEQHVLAEHAVASPVSAEDTVAYLRALLCDDPPRRWHGYKRARGRVYGDVCSKLLAFHAANAHVDDVVIHHVGQLWARLCK